MFQKPDWIKILKTAVGAGIAIVLAEAVGLRFAASAGVITLLSIQDTKRETIRVVFRRLISFGIAMVLSFFCFRIFGYGAFAVAIFLLFFAAICIGAGMQEGISVNTVLMTHFLSEQTMSWSGVANELGLLLVGAGIGVILNLYIPGKKKVIKITQRQIEERMKSVLEGMECVLVQKNPAELKEGRTHLAREISLLGQELADGEKNAYLDMENRLLSDTKYYIRYMSMRRNQEVVFKRIQESLRYLHMVPSQAGEIAALTGRIRASLHEHNNAIGLLEDVKSVKGFMETQPLPGERDEFESRAVLFGILLELEQFLRIKKEFVEQLTEAEIRQFWDGRERNVDNSREKW